MSEKQSVMFVPVDIENEDGSVFRALTVEKCMKLWELMQRINPQVQERFAGEADVIMPIWELK